MEIVFKDYKITGDEEQATLYKLRIPEKGNQKGEEVWAPIAYFPTMRALLLRLIDITTLSSEASSLQEVLDHVKDLTKVIEEALGEASLLKLSRKKGGQKDEADQY